MYERQRIPKPKRQVAPPAAGSASRLTSPFGALDSPVDDTIFRARAPAVSDFGSVAVLQPERQVGSEGGQVSDDLAGSIRRRGEGAALDSTTRASMESTFGHNFADVRIHRDEESDALNRSVGANAFTVGTDIFLSQAATSAGPYGGDRLLAHELTHVVQQGGARMGGTLSVSAADDPHEREASAIGREVSAGNAAGGVRTAPKVQGGVATARVQRDGDDAEPKSGKSAAKAKPTIGSLAADVETLKHQQAAAQKHEKAIGLDLEWRAKFGQKLATYKQAVWRITWGIDAANKGFQDAQVAQARADAMWAQIVGLAASVLFAGGFEWIVGGALGKVGSKLNWAEGRVGKIVEKLENPANALWGGLWTNVRTTYLANKNAQEGQTPAITGGGGGAIAYLAQQSEALEKHAGNMEGAFLSRAVQMKGLTDAEWESIDVDAQATEYARLYTELESAGKGVEDLQTPELVGGIIECHLWAAWIKDNHSVIVGWISQVSSNSSGTGMSNKDEYERENPDKLDNFGNEINERLILLGVEAAANTGLYTHWWQRNADGWEKAIMNWARNYKRTVAR